MCGLNCPLTVVRRRRCGSSSQHTHTNCRDGGPVNFRGSPGVVVSSGVAKGDPVCQCVSVSINVCINVCQCVHERQNTIADWGTC